jgi:hypothetical protein
MPIYELPPGLSYTAGEVDSKISSITGQPERELVAGLTEIDRDVAMEFGLILPRPGVEAEWFVANAHALDGIHATSL